MRRWLLVLTAATTALVLAALLVPLALLTRTHAAERATAEATARAQYVASGAGAVLGTGAAESFVDGANSASGPATSVILADGRVLGAPARVSDAVRLARRGRAFTYAAPDGGRLVLVPVQGPREGTAVVQVALTKGQLYEGMLASWLILAGIGLGLVLVGLLIADRLGARLVGSARRLAGVAERLSDGDLTARAAPSGPPELQLVAAELNHLAARIDDLLTAERENAADLAHRLRTPMAALRLDAEGLRDPAEGERITASAAALEQQVDEVIRRARKPLRTRPERSDLARVARERAAFWLPLAEDQGRELTVSTGGVGLWVAVAEDDLGAALDALIGNVLDHTPQGTAFRVMAGPGPQGSVRLEVADEGPGFGGAAPERGASGAGSTGLGLDIVRRTAKEAGGRCAVDGAGGARVTLFFPRTAQMFPRTAQN
ncbi:HAMP domain-containing sensor histidine kinase [Streptomyces sp. B-S-A8]|uniref:histidine kinase n=1 Tax=Streptomyces solicavernae TaxID=3043614 RepID=A0ABT6RJP6_9ACTN|nr:HAMP domain-containing sensor histidine kinase [Streptomyces sp. B-S-A8]MDI3384644.1 HAMP domain-containing sensor histidine kinase [Streptomyces sp. B-S-A8]